MNDPRPAQRSWLEVRWRQFKNPPQPVFRAVTVNLAVAIVGGLLLLVYAVAAPAADLTPWIALYVVVVIVAGSLATYVWVAWGFGARLDCTHRPTERVGESSEDEGEELEATSENSPLPLFIKVLMRQADGAAGWIAG